MHSPGTGHMVRKPFAMVQTVEGHEVIPSNEKAPGARNTEGPDTDTTNDLNFAIGQRHGKAVATLMAQLAILGHAVHPLKDGGFLVCKRGYTHYAADIEALQAFARKLGVTP